MSYRRPTGLPELAPLLLRCVAKLEELGLSLRGLRAIGALPEDYLSDCDSWKTESMICSGSSYIFRWYGIRRGESNAIFLLCDVSMSVFVFCKVCRQYNLTPPDVIACECSGCAESDQRRSVSGHHKKKRKET